MSTYRAANPYTGLKFDFESYEVEVEKGRRRLLFALVLNMVLVIINVISSQLTIQQQTATIEKLMRLQLQTQQIPNGEQLLKQMLDQFNSPTYVLYVLVSQIALYLVIAVLPWVAIYLGKHWAKGIVGLFALIQGIASVIAGPILLWFGFYGFAALALAYGTIKLYTVWLLFVVPSVKKYFSHVNL